MRNTGLSARTANRFGRACRAIFVLVALAVPGVCVPPTIIPITLKPGVTARTSLPPGRYLNRAARVRLRFVDAPLRSRGGNSWNYTVNFRMSAINNKGASVGPAQNSSLTIFRGMDRESFEAVAVM